MLYYYAMLTISIIILFLYLVAWDKSYDLCATLILIIVPLSNVGYVSLARARTAEAALVANQVTYFGGIFIQMLAMLFVCNICKIHKPKWILLLLMSISSFLFISVLNVQNSNLFYTSYYLNRKTDMSTLVTTYGPIHTFFYVFLMGNIILGIIILIYSIRHLNVSNINASYMLFSYMGGTIAYIIKSFFSLTVEVMPLVYTICEIFVFIVSVRTSMYEFDKRVNDDLGEAARLGYFMLDSKRRYLGGNEDILKYYPEMRELKIDSRMGYGKETYVTFHKLLNRMEEAKHPIEKIVSMGGFDFRIRVDYIYSRKRKCGYKIMLFDITEEEQHKRVLSEMNEKLIEEKERAEEASHAKGRFLANMSHEIRTPINAVLGLDTMILRESKEPNIRGYAHDIQSAGKSLMSIINDILDFSKIESGKMQLVQEEYSLADVINDVINMIKPRAEENKLEFTVNVDECMPSHYRGDDMRIKQILINLLTNAIKYTPKGSVKLEIQAKADEDYELLSFYIRDTGIGIRPEDIALLTEEFVRIDESRNRNIEGTGLGINIVASLLRLMNSKLEVESVYGEGSVFHFTLRQCVMDSEPIGPVENFSSSVTEEEEYAASFVIPNSRLLVVDDNAVNRKIFCNLLKELQCKIDEAESGRECLELVQSVHYDIIFMDHMMPEMDGIETFHRMKALGDYLNAETPVVILTANAISGAREEYMAEGFDDYLTKPIDANKLESMIGELIGVDRQQEVVQETLEPELPLIDGVDWQNALQKLKKISILESSVDAFWLMAQSDMDALKGMYDTLKLSGSEEDYDAFRIKVHSMKSNAATMGANHVAGLAKYLEYAARDKDMDTIHSLLPLFEKEWLLLHDAVGEGFGKETTVKQDIGDLLEIDKDTLEECLRILDEAMDELDLDRADAAMEELVEHSYPEEQRPLIEKLRLQVMNMDSEACAVTIQQLRELL